MCFEILFFTFFYTFNFTIFKYFTIEGVLKGGYINMPDIRTTKSNTDYASQEFFFGETTIAFGGIFRI